MCELEQGTAKQIMLQRPTSPAVFVFLSEIPALRFVTDSKGGGIKLMKDAYRLHINDPEVVENICMLINEMVQYGEIMALFVASLPLPQKIVKQQLLRDVSCSQEKLNYVSVKGG